MEAQKTEITFYNPIDNKEEMLSIQKMPLNRIRLGGLRPYKTDDDIYRILISILKDIDMSKTISSMLPCTLDSVRYNSSLSEYIYYLEHSVNQLNYNYWIDVLIQRHIMNIIIERNFVPPTIQKTKDKKLISKKDNLKNMFYRRQTFNLFSEEPEYEYINPKTGEIVTSTDPNLCDKLNAELEKMKNKNKPRRSGGGRKSKIENAKVVRTPDFSKMKFKF